MQRVADRYPTTRTKCQASDNGSRKYTSRPWPILSLNLDRANGMASCVSTRRSKNLHNPGVDSVLENFAFLQAV
jgi:hypothetical protein